MVRPLHEFGGWLSFFYWMNWFNFGGVCLTGVISVISLIRGNPEPGYTWEAATVIVRSLMVAFIFFFILMEIKNKDMATPTKIYRWINWYLIASLVLAVFVGLIQYVILKMHWIPTLTKFTGTVMGVYLWWSIWTGYFKHSKRVMAYYGDNA